MTTSAQDRIFGAAASLAVKAPCRAATTANITLSGLQTIDGVVLADGDRVLVKNQTNGVQNGIYIADSGDWDRAPDFDGNRDITKGTLVLISDGTTNAATIYELTSAVPITIGSSTLTFTIYTNTPPSVPVTIAQGGTNNTTATGALANLGVVECTSVAGTNSITCTIDAGVTAYRTNHLFQLTPANTNTGATTITPTPSGGGPLAGKNIFANGAACVGGELVAGVPTLLLYDGTQFQIIGYSFFQNLAADALPAKATDYVPAYDASAKLYKRVLMEQLPLPRMYISGLIQANNAGDATNDIDISAGSARDATDATNLHLTASITKQSDVAWAVGTAAGGLDTGAVGNSDYYIWLIKRSDTGVVDVLFSLSSTAPTMPTNYDYKRLIGWFKRVGGTIVAFTAYETEGGGLELLWTAPTLDIDLTSTLTTARRTDAVKVPLNFSTVALLNVLVSDATTAQNTYVYCPDGSDQGPSSTVAPLVTINSLTSQNGARAIDIRTSAAGLIAARSDLATVDAYRVSTRGFRWARRN